MLSSQIDATLSLISRLRCCRCCRRWPGRLVLQLWPLFGPLRELSVLAVLRAVFMSGLSPRITAHCKLSSVMNLHDLFIFSILSIYSSTDSLFPCFRFHNSDMFFHLSMSESKNRFSKCSFNMVLQCPCLHLARPSHQSKTDPLKSRGNIFKSWASVTFLYAAQLSR